MFFPIPTLCDVYRALFESQLYYGDVVRASLPSDELSIPQCSQIVLYQLSEVQGLRNSRPKKWLNVENLIRFDQSDLV